ncbi:MAG: YncE family protein [Opitutales bacterium]
MIFPRILPVAAGLLLAGSVLAQNNPPIPAPGPYHFLKEIPLGGEGGWDYVSVDPVAHRLYVSHGAKVVVLDTRTDAVVGEIADTPGIHGIAVAPKSGRAYTSNGREDKVSMVDTATWRTLAKLDAGKNPDAILYEPSREEVYAFNGRSNSVSVFAAAGGPAVATIAVEGKPEFAQADPAAGRVYVNIEDHNQVDALNTRTHEVVARWSLAPGESPTGLDIDCEHHRLFAGCGNALLVVLDSADGRRVATIPAGKGIDAVAFDPTTQLVFTSNGRDGTVTVVHQDSPEHYTVVQTLPTEPRARTMALDTSTHTIYLPSARFENAPAGSGPQRPTMVPGSFKLLVYTYAP